MAKRTKSICVRPGCGRKVEEGKGPCAQCRAKEEKRRGTSTERGYGARHRRWRTAVLARWPVCCRCRTVDRRITPATVADHIVPWKGRHASLRFSIENGQGLCAPCHNVKGKHEERGEFPDWRPTDDG